MIRKVLLLALVIVLLIGLISSFTHGVNISLFGQIFTTSSYSTIIKESQQLVDQRATLERLNTKDFENEKTKLKSSESRFNSAKQAYDDVANNASVEEIRKANQEEKYLLDYLWIKIGTYANDSDIKVKIDPDEEKRTINFNVSGQYIAIINFIYDLENDQELKFNVDNIVMQGGSSSAVTKASFVVKNVRVVRTDADDVE